LGTNPITKANSIGIELFNNVGEPYHGQQITALIKLVDILIRIHPTIPRPSYPRDTKTTGVVTHGEIQENRKDPTGLFRLPSVVFYADEGIPGCDDFDFCQTDLPGGDGGQGGEGGSIACTLCDIYPPPKDFPSTNILSHDSGQRGIDVLIRKQGSLVSVKDAVDLPGVPPVGVLLYRVASGKEIGKTLGGFGGFPGGTAQRWDFFCQQPICDPLFFFEPQPGFHGVIGAGAEISGLPVKK